MRGEEGRLGLRCGCLRIVNRLFDDPNVFPMLTGCHELEEVLNLLASLNQGGTTIIMVTHSQRDAEYAQRIVRLFDGQIINENIKAGVSEIPII